MTVSAARQYTEAFRTGAAGDHAHVTTLMVPGLDPDPDLVPALLLPVTVTLALGVLQKWVAVITSAVSIFSVLNN